MAVLFNNSINRPACISACTLVRGSQVIPNPSMAACLIKYCELKTKFSGTRILSKGKHDKK